MKTLRGKAWDELLEKLEALHRLAIQADAFYSAHETLSDGVSRGASNRRRVLNQMDCISDELGQRIEELLHESQSAVEFLLKRVSR